MRSDLTGKAYTTAVYKLMPVCLRKIQCREVVFACRVKGGKKAFGKLHSEDEVNMERIIYIVIMAKVFEENVCMRVFISPGVYIHAD